MSGVYRINTRTREIKREELKKEQLLFGGRGLIARVMNEEVDPLCDPLGNENKLVFSTGLMAGSTIPCTHRLSVGGKSPLTKGIKEANAGGNVAYLLARHNIKMIILEDKPEDDSWWIVRIDNTGDVQLLPADEFAGINNYSLVEKLHAKFGKDMGVVSIGVAGERGYRNSSLQVTDFINGHPSRAAARGGLGAVMGSKRMKALVVEKPSVKSKFSILDKQRYDALKTHYVECMLQSPFAAMYKLGTPSLVDRQGLRGALPTRNFSGGFFDKLENINTNAFFTKINTNEGKTWEPCQQGCVFRCSNTYKNDKREYVTSGLEYETIGLLGSNCDIGDLDVIAEMDRLCDDLGIDTIETGASIGVCMEAGKISWSDSKAAIGLIQEMIEGTEFGHLMGQGTETLAKALGVKRIPTVKGQALPAYDPRNMKGIGVTCSTSPMGADHTAGMAVDSEPTRKEGKVNLSVLMQNHAAVCDNIMCSFAWSAFALNSDKLKIIVELLACMYEADWDLDKLMSVGKETLSLERAFNKAAGFSEKDDCLPEFFIKEQSSFTGSEFDITCEELVLAANRLGA